MPRLSFDLFTGKLFYHLSKLTLYVFFKANQVSLIIWLLSHSDIFRFILFLFYASCDELMPLSALGLHFTLLYGGFNDE